MNHPSDFPSVAHNLIGSTVGQKSPNIRGPVRSFFAIVAAAGLVLTISGCGQAETPAVTTVAASRPIPPATAKETRYPLTIDNCGRKITFTSPPKRVVLLNGTSVAEVESFITLGIQDRIAGNSQRYDVSDDPQMVAKIKAIPTGGLRWNQNFEVPREQVLALKPDLVVSTWSGGFDHKIGSITRDQLAAAGINSFVTPTNCANGAPDPSPEDKRKYEQQSITSSFELLLSLGEIFNVQQKAADHVNSARTRLAPLQAKLVGKRVKSVLVVYPGMSMMNKNGLPAVFGGGVYDDIVQRAGGNNPFGGMTNNQLAEINVEALASARVDVLVVGLFTSTENPKTMAAVLFKKFPQWQASKTRTYTTVSDSGYLGPLNVTAIERIAHAAHGPN